MNYSENESIKIIVNRSQCCNLFQLDHSVTEVLYLAQVSCAVELWNNFLKETNINLTNITNSKYSLKKKYLNRFINSLQNYVNDSNNLSTSEVIPSEVSNNSRNDISRYRILLEYKFLIRNRYRLLRFNSRNSTLYCMLSNNEVVIFNSPMELVNLRVKHKNDNDISIVESIDLNENGVYDITLNNI